MKLYKPIILASVLSWSSWAAALQTDVATGQTSTLFIHNGSLYCSGDMTHGACTHGERVEGLSTDDLLANQRFSHHEGSELWVPTYIGYDHIQSVDAVMFRSGYLTQDNEVFWFGTVLGDDYRFLREEGVPVEIEDLRGASDMTHAGYRDLEPVVYGVIEGQVWVHDLRSETTTQVQGLPDTIVAVDGDSSHTLFLSADGRLFAAGLNDYGQLGSGDHFGTAADQAVEVVDEMGRALIGVQSMSAGGRLSAAIVDGDVYVWGRNGSGALGIGSLDDDLTRNYAGRLDGFDGNAVAVSAAGALLIQGADGSLWGVGWHNGIMGGAWNRSVRPTRLVADGVEALYVNNGDVKFLRHEGQIKGFGGAIYGQHGHGSNTETHVLTAIDPWVGSPQWLECATPEPEIVEVEVPGPVVTIIEYVEVETPRDLQGMTVDELRTLRQEAREMIRTKKRIARQIRKFERCVQKAEKRGKPTSQCVAPDTVATR